MKKTKLLVLTVLPFLVGGCSIVEETSSSEEPESSIPESSSTESSSPETSSEPSSSSSKKEPADLVRKEIEVTMVSHFKGDLGSRLRFCGLGVRPRTCGLGVRPCTCGLGTGLHSPCRVPFAV